MAEQEVEEMECSSTSISDLPEEILEHILMKVSPYNDLKSAMIVSTLWSRIAKGVMYKMRQHFLQSVYEAKVNWTPIQPDVGSRITERYSHCSCYYNKSIYIFGGCTSSNTTLNDLWRFDLASREWIRPLAMGTYPFPKACASMVVYKDSLVLFGGWSHPLPFPLHQAAQFFSELHIYSPLTNRWSLVTTLSHESPKPTAGHSASIVGDKMVVFGGSQASGVRTNEVWVFDFNEMAWQKPRVSNHRPSARYGMSQVTLDENHIVILGGCGGPNQIFSDMWLLTLDTDPWEWTEVKLANLDNAALQIWCHPACKVGDTIVVLSKPAKASAAMATDANPMKFKSNRVWVPPRDTAPPPRDTVPPPKGARGQARPEVASPSPSTSADDRSQRPMDQSESQNVSHDAATSQSEQSASGAAGTFSPRPGLPSVRPNAMKDRQRQLEALLKYEKKLRQSGLSSPADTSDEDSPPPPPSYISPADSQPVASSHMQSCDKNPASVMTVHVLDISRVLETRTAAWQPLRVQVTNVPEETIFYSLVEGRSELIMFGGIERDIQTMQRGQGLKSHVVSNTLYLINPWPATL